MIQNNTGVAKLPEKFDGHHFPWTYLIHSFRQDRAQAGCRGVSSHLMSPNSRWEKTDRITALWN